MRSSSCCSCVSTRTILLLRLLLITPLPYSNIVRRRSIVSRLNLRGFINYHLQAISYETYRIVILRRKPRSGTPVKALLIILLIWLYVLVLLGVGLGLTFVKKEGRLPFFGNTIWCKLPSVLQIFDMKLNACYSGCSIRAPPYLAGSLAKYTCYWAAALMSIFLYGSMAWTLYRIPKEELLRGGEDAGEAAQIARKMILYVTSLAIRHLILLGILTIRISVTRSCTPSAYATAKP